MNNLKDIDMKLATLRTAIMGEADLQKRQAFMQHFEALEKERDYILYQDAA